MERVRGATIADLTAGTVRLADALAIGIATLDALERVHAARFVHRDLKPDNLVRTGDGVVILDLGLARKLPADPDDPTRANVQVGSLEYMPPEQIADSASVDERSDLYAFGCILYELLAGRPPFVGDAAALERAHAALRPPRLGALASVPAAIEALVHDCLAKEPARRQLRDRARPRSPPTPDRRDRRRAHRRAPAARAATRSRRGGRRAWRAGRDRRAAARPTAARPAACPRGSPTSNASRARPARRARRAVGGARRWRCADAVPAASRDSRGRAPRSPPARSRAPRAAAGGVPRARARARQRRRRTAGARPPARRGCSRTRTGRCARRPTPSR